MARGKISRGPFVFKGIHWAVGPVNSISTDDSFADVFLRALDRNAGPAQSTRLRILDVGSGSARIPIEICRRLAGAFVTAIDRSPVSCERSRRNVHVAGLTAAIVVEQADATSLPGSDQAFDSVISNGLLHHLPDPSVALREMLRVLRPGGLLFVRDSLRARDADLIEQVLSRSGGQSSTVPAPRPKAITLAQAQRLIVETGLPGEWVKPWGPSHWVICGRLPG
jgi:ubiquinone/menaquinone biosynthesis C-methylase UbiE